MLSFDLALNRCGTGTVDVFRKVQRKTQDKSQGGNHKEKITRDK
jgi:hypothetical protein